MYRGICNICLQLRTLGKGINMQPKPKFVIISDIHFNEKNLKLSHSALSQALSKAEELDIPLVIAGDLNDTKAIIRAEVANDIIEIILGYSTPVFILVGNHDKINEKGEEHGLNYLRPYAQVVDFPSGYKELPGVVFIPYQSDPTNYSNIIKQKCSKGDIIVMHQGVFGANLGDYVHDKSAIDVSILEDHKCFSGHYHQHQTIGTLTYCGSPFTMSFGEASDGPKGFLVVNEDGSFTREILNLRKHIIQDINAEAYWEIGAQDPKDVLWVKLHGTKSYLDNIQKYSISKFIGHSNFKLDKIPTDDQKLELSAKPLTGEELLDKIIDNKSDTTEYKNRLKSIWRELLS